MNKTYYNEHLELKENEQLFESFKEYALEMVNNGNGCVSFDNWLCANGWMPFDDIQDDPNGSNAFFLKSLLANILENANDSIHPSYGDIYGSEFHITFKPEKGNPITYKFCFGAPVWNALAEFSNYIMEEI